MRKIITGFGIVLLLLSVMSSNAADVSREQIKGLDEQVQDIKKDVINLTADLLQLEEKLLYPSNSQFSVFVSLADKEDLRLDAVHVKLKDKVLAHHLYTFRELESLRKGGVQRIYTGNVRTGDHELVVSYSAKSSSGDVKHSSRYTLNKAVGPKFVEIKIGDPSADESGIMFKDW